MAQNITNEEVEKLLASIKLPPRPAVIEEINIEKNKEYPNLKIMGQIITKDMALTAAMLKTANSKCCVLFNSVSCICSILSCSTLQRWVANKNAKAFF